MGRPRTGIEPRRERNRSDGDQTQRVRPAVSQLPTLRHREATRMAFAQVVIVGITLGAEVIEPHLRPTVLV
jgi:hypothetical protein